MSVRVTKRDQSERIVWHTKGLPDSDIAVLVYVPASDDDAVWFGYHDGGGWYYVEGGGSITVPVKAWAHLPEGPKL